MMTKTSIWTPANIVTTIRIVCIPIFVLIFLAPWPDLFVSNVADIEEARPWVTAFAFFLLSATDGVDGYLARSRNEVTTFGKFIDPIADKLLVTAALLALIEVGSLPSWIALIIISREFLVSGLRMIASSSGVVIAASWYGKLKTVITIIAILMFIVKDSYPFSASHLSPYFSVIAWCCMGLAVLLTIVSMIDYFNKSAYMLFKSES